MDTAVLRAYLHRHIPLSRAMEVDVLDASTERTLLSAPLAPNINHRDTAFGGSASALAILAAWTLVYVRLRHSGIEARIVIQRNSMSYERAIATTFTAEALLPADDAAWDRFVAMYRRKGRARIGVAALLRCEGLEVGRFKGDFVAVQVPTPASGGVVPSWPIEE